MSTKIVLRNTFFYGFANALQKVSGFFILFVAALFLAPEEYGHLALITFFSGIVHMGISSTIHGAIIRFYIDLEGENRRRFIGTAIVFILAVGLGCLAVLFVTGPDLVRRIFPRAHIAFYPLFAMSLGAVLFMMPQEIANSIFKIKETPKALISLLYASVALATTLPLVLVIVFRLGLRGLLLGQLLASFGIFWVCLKKIRNEFLIGFHWRLLRPALLFSYPMIPYIVMEFMRNRAAIYILEKSVDMKDVGFYYFGLSVGMIMTAIVSAFATSYSSRMFNVLKERPLEIAKGEIARTYKYVFLLTNLAFVFICYFSEEFILLFLPKYTRAFSLVPLITASYFLGGIYLFFHNSFYWVKKTGLVSLGSFVLSGITILAQILLIPRNGIMGSAIGLLIGQTAGLSIGYLLSQKAFSMKYPFKEIALVGSLSMIFVFSMAYGAPNLGVIWRVGLKVITLAILILLTIRKAGLTMRSFGPQAVAMIKSFKSA